MKDWVEAAGKHGPKVHPAKVLPPRDLGQVQADEIRGKIQGGLLWLAMAIMVSTRLWLGGVIGATRDTGLIAALVAFIRACAAPSPLLLVTDGLSAYVKCFRRAFRPPQGSRGRGRPRWIPWEGWVIGQVVKRYKCRRVVAVCRRLVQGSEQVLPSLLALTQGGGMLNTAYSERLNATFRNRLAALARRTRNLVRREPLLQAGMYLVGTVYNFCTFHASLTQDGLRRTPAMAAGITDHCWSVAGWLWYRVPPPPWRPPRRRGRPSKELQKLVAQWVT